MGRMGRMGGLEWAVVSWTDGFGCCGLAKREVMWESWLNVGENGMRVE